MRDCEEIGLCVMVPEEARSFLEADADRSGG